MSIYVTCSAEYEHLCPPSAMQRGSGAGGARRSVSCDASNERSE